MKQDKVFEILKEDRLYQNGIRWNKRKDGSEYEDNRSDSEKTPADWILYMEHKLNEAKNSLYNLEPSQAILLIKKTTALGVAALENLLED